MAHAGGPWLFDLDEMEIRGQYGRVASIQPRMDAIHNGRLIAAAPDMLQALRAARARLALIFESDDRDPRDDATVQEIDAAIEKAEGV